MNPPPIFSPGRLGHVNVTVERLDAAIAFHRDVCGLNLEFTESGIKGAFMGTGLTPHDIGMVEAGPDARRGRDGRVQVRAGAVSAVGLNHIAWEMDSEEALVASYRRARAAGMAAAMHGFDHRIAKSLYLKDPDGNTNEFYADSLRDWRAEASGDVHLITSAWDPEAAAPAAEPRWSPVHDRRPVAHALLQPGRLSHVVLATTALAPMCAFYREVAGLEPVHLGESGALFRARRHGTPYQLAIVQAPAKGLHHWAFELAPSQPLAAAQERLRAAGTPAQRQDGPIRSNLFLTDPDGFRIAFHEAGAGTPAAFEAAFALPGAERMQAL